jgi:hypothetical protein
MSQYYRLVRPCDHDTFVERDSNNNITPCRDGIPISEITKATPLKTNAFCTTCLQDPRSYKPDSAIADLDIAAPAWYGEFINFPLGDVGSYFLQAAKRSNGADWKLGNDIDRKWLIDAHISLQQSSREHALVLARSRSLSADSHLWAGSGEVLALLTEIMEFNLVVAEDQRRRAPKTGVLRKKKCPGTGPGGIEEVKNWYRTPQWLSHLIIGTDGGQKYHRRLTMNEGRLKRTSSSSR